LRQELGTQFFFLKNWFFLKNVRNFDETAEFLTTDSVSTSKIDYQRKVKLDCYAFQVLFLLYNIERYFWKYRIYYLFEKYRINRKNPILRWIGFFEKSSRMARFKLFILTRLTRGHSFPENFHFWPKNVKKSENGNKPVINTLAIAFLQ
jgi:poly(A) polymerase Pap1